MLKEQKKKTVKKAKFWRNCRFISQNLLSRNGRFSFDKLENIYSYHSHLFLKKFRSFAHNSE